MRMADPGFLPGVCVGGVLAAAALWLGLPPVLAESMVAAVGASAAAEWVLINLGGSVWAFTLVLALWGWHLSRLGRLLAERAPRQESAREVAHFDQLSDVWTHLFVGIGVVWTAIGMRAALQTTLGDPESALSASAGSVLRNLVDGGILLALTTTIVGAVGGYLMRLGKTLWLGSALHAHYEAAEGRDLRELIDATHRIESSLRLDLSAAATERADTEQINPAVRGRAQVEPEALRRWVTAAHRRQQDASA